MSSYDIPDEVLGRLRAAKTTMLKRTELREIIDAKDEVLARYGPAFQPGSIATIEEPVLRSFLYIENNHHWSGLYRQANRICANMPKTRAALAALVDEKRPLEQRTRAVIDIKGMGKGIITAILLVAYPEKYGVWNNTSQSGLAQLGLIPAFHRGATFAERYDAINSVLLELARLLDVDLWTLDTIWWHLEGEEEDEDDDDAGAAESVSSIQRAWPRPASTRFALERHLHDYMFDNWEQLELARDWDLFVRDGEPEAGYEYPTSVGRIDLLTKHKRESRWLVIELKRDASSDVAVGQVLRYMGWVQSHVAEPGETVEGLIVATKSDDHLRYAVSMISNVSFKLYEVEFRLRDGPSIAEVARP
jgi:hypothetical protein